jgi:hypothetical protein
LLLPCTVTLAPGAAARVAETGARVPTASGFCCVDTGSKLSAIDIGVMHRLQIEAWDYAKLVGCSSREPVQTPLFAARLSFPGSGLPDLTLADFVGAHLGYCEAKGQPTVALLGRAALSRFTMLYDGVTSTVTFFRRQ